MPRTHTSAIAILLAAGAAHAQNEFQVSGRDWLNAATFYSQTEPVAFGYQANHAGTPWEAGAWGGYNAVSASFPRSPTSFTQSQASSLCDDFLILGPPDAPPSVNAQIRTAILANFVNNHQDQPITAQVAPSTGGFTTVRPQIAVGQTSLDLVLTSNVYTLPVGSEFSIKILCYTNVGGYTGNPAHAVSMTYGYAGDVLTLPDGYTVHSACAGVRYNTYRGPCAPDLTTTNANPGDPGFGVPDTVVNGADLSYFVEQWLAGNLSEADFTTTNANPGDPGFGVPDGGANGADLSYFVELWLAGCP